MLSRCRRRPIHIIHVNDIYLYTPINISTYTYTYIQICNVYIYHRDADGGLRQLAVEFLCAQAGEDPLAQKVADYGAGEENRGVKSSQEESEPEELSQWPLAVVENTICSMSGADAAIEPC